MGMTLKAHCSVCGYEARVSSGGGMEDFLYNNPQPVLCRKCVAVTDANFAKEPLVCNCCGSEDVSSVEEFHDPRAVDGTSVEDIDHRRRSPDADRRFLCPKCSKFELRFDRVRSYD